MAIRTLVILIFGTLLGFPIVGMGQNAVDSNTTYIWPTDASPYMSGTFAETRSKHFHSALDIKTWGRKGYRVFATRKGILHRIAISPSGYGKVIYLKHPDGTYSVYAHLLSFEERIQQLADSIRFRDYSHNIDMVVDSLGIQVAQGQVIGYTGATGVGPPHLHFELRTPSEKPFNPLLTNLTVPDNISPQFSGLSVEPLSPKSRIEGENSIYTKRTIRRAGYYDFGTIDVRGPVGLGVDVFDQANNVSNAYAVYDLKLYLEDQLIFHSRVDSFAYDETDQMFLDRVYPILQNNGSGYQRMFVADGNTLSFYKETVNSGRLNLREGTYELRIVAEDYSGNQSNARLVLNAQNENQAPVPAYHTNGSNGSNGTNGTEKKGWSWHSDWINFNGVDSFEYLITSIDTSNHTALPLKTGSASFLSLNKFDFISIKPPDHAPLHLFRMIPDRKGKVYGSNINAYAKFRADTFYDTLSVALTGTTFRRDSVKIQIDPGNQPVRKGFELTYVLNDSRPADSTLAFYSYNKRRNRFRYLPTRLGGTVLKGNAENLGTYFVLSDTLAPELFQPRIFRREDGQWVASIHVHDTRSGVNPDKTLFYINGIRGIAEYEPDDHRILYYHPAFQPAKENRLHIVVMDRTGNRTEKTYNLN